MRRRKDTVTLFVCLCVASISLTIIASLNNGRAVSSNKNHVTSHGFFSGFSWWGENFSDKTAVSTRKRNMIKVLFKAYNLTDRHLSTLREVLVGIQVQTDENNRNVTTAGEKGVEIPRFILGDTTLCDGADILVYVQSKVGNVLARRTIRRTWASGTSFDTLNVRTMFIIGRPENTDDQVKINNEQILHGDIVEGDFKDSFHNLSLKSVIAMHWIRHYCTGVKYVIKADDDMFVNSFKVVELVLPNLTHSAIACHAVKAGTSPIVRDKNSRWYIPAHIFPNETHFPPFCSGYVVFMTSRLVSDLYSQVKTSPLIYVDDVYMFGQLTKSLGNVEFLDFKKNFTLTQDRGLESYRAGRQEFLAVNVRGTAAMEELWSLALMNRSPWARDNSKVNTTARH